MLLGLIDQPLEIVRLQAFLCQRNIKSANKRRARRGVLGVHRGLKRPARLLRMRIFGCPSAHVLLLTPNKICHSCSEKRERLSNPIENGGEVCVNCVKRRS